MKTPLFFFIILLLGLTSPNINSQNHRLHKYSYKGLKAPNSPHKHTYSTISMPQIQQLPNTSLGNTNNHYYKQYQPAQSISNTPIFTSLPSPNLSTSFSNNTNTPFYDPIETSRPFLVNRNETPDDPSVPISNSHIPLILCTILWTITKYIKNKEKKTKFIP